MHLFTSTKKFFSTEELRRQLGHKRDQPNFEMTNKLRDVMGKRDNQYQLAYHMEFNDAYFSTTNIVKVQVYKSAELITDVSISYTRLIEYVKSHEAKVIDSKMVHVLLPWGHIAISNSKRLFLDVHHKIKNEYIQYYLNEFCYKLNRRYFGDNIFDRLLMVAVSYTHDFKSKIHNRTLCG